MAFLRHIQPVQHSLALNSFSLFRLASCRYASSLPVGGWSYPPSATDVADDEVARLAASPRRPLTLADLLR